MNRIAKKLLQAAVILAFWVAVWWFASWRVGLTLLLPSPLAVLQKWGEMLGTASFYRSVLTSLWNVVAGILLATLGGILLAILTASAAWLRALILPLMTVVKATPVASFIVLALIWLGAARVPTLITVLIVLPLIWTNLDEGLSRQDAELVELAKVYRFPLGKRLKVLVFPSVLPYFLSAGRASLGLAWKAGIAAEIIARPLGSIGTGISDARQYLETEEVFAWTLTVILLSLLIEYGFASLFPERKEK